MFAITLNNNMGKYREYTDQDIIDSAKEVTSLSKLLDKLGLRQAGGNFTNMKKHLQRLNVDCNHWNGQAWSKGEQLKDWSQYTRAVTLKPHLLKLKSHTCENCNRTEWMGEKIPLEIEHVDGDRTNNELANLKLLCCNCHALTPTWRRRKDIVGVEGLEPSSLRDEA